METKCCSRCNETKEVDKFIKARNICKKCNNEWAKLSKQKRYESSILSNDEKICNTCNETKSVLLFMKDRYICKDCHNQNRKNRYKNDEDHRLNLIQSSVISKKKHRDRYNERNRQRYHSDPIFKFMSNQRSRIAIALNKKQKHTIDYLDCNADEYFQWLQYQFTDEFTFENHGKVWHVDHVIPLSTFDLKNQEQQFLAFNWRNTMPLLINDNLVKNTKIISSQIEQHLKTLTEYHTKNNIEIPQTFIDLYAKHLDDGKPLKLSLPLADGNICKDLG